MPPNAGPAAAIAPLTDLEIARATPAEPIATVAARLGIPAEHLHPYGRDKAKVSLSYLAGLPENPHARLVLVSAISPTPPGEGKTTTSIGLADGLRAIGRDAMVCLREPSMGPVFGLKGGAAGGGRAQVIPMEDINLHFTGDFSAIALAHNLLAALVDNHVHHGNALGIDVRRITWRRVVDVNDRALRQVTVGLGGPANGYPREDGFDIVVASEVMAILCLATSHDDLKRRLGDIVVAYTRDRTPVHARDLRAEGAMAVLLKDALEPNLVQTLEHTPAFVHGGPFANIAHGCNSVVATAGAMRLADYVVTEAGFGADLGGEKFLDIKARLSGLHPHAVVVVATVRALKHHGGAAGDLGVEDLAALTRGLPNLARHLHNLREVHGMRCVVAVNTFATDTESELEVLEAHADEWGVPVVRCTHWADGGAGSAELARVVVDLCEQPSTLRFTYPDEATLLEKVTAIATRVYGAAEVTADSRVQAQFEDLQARGFGRLPVCIAKTPYSFSTDPSLLGAPVGHSLDVREVRLAAGAGFVVAICGDVMTMPGLPSAPASERIDLVDGQVVGLF